MDKDDHLIWEGWEPPPNPYDADKYGDQQPGGEPSELEKQNSAKLAREVKAKVDPNIWTVTHEQTPTEVNWPMRIPELSGPRLPWPGTIVRVAKPNVEVTFHLQFAMGSDKYILVASLFYKNELAFDEFLIDVKTQRNVDPATGGSSSTLGEEGVVDWAKIDSVLDELLNHINNFK